MPRLKLDLAIMRVSEFPCEERASTRRSGLARCSNLRSEPYAAEHLKQEFPKSAAIGPSQRSERIADMVTTTTPTMQPAGVEAYKGAISQHPEAAAHLAAATHHAAAAHHHMEAAHEHSQGAHDEAKEHVIAAAAHSEQAHQLSTKAAETPKNHIELGASPNWIGLQAVIGPFGGFSAGLSWSSGTDRHSIRLGKFNFGCLGFLSPMLHKDKKTSSRKTLIAEALTQATVKISAEHKEQTSTLQQVADRVTAILGHPLFIVGLFMAILAWVAGNLVGGHLGYAPIDPPPSSGCKA